MDNELKEQLGLILDTLGRLEEKVDENTKQINENRQSILMLEITVENKISKKIETLFDAYKLTHEKQWELESRMDKLELLVEQLQNQIA